MGLMHASTLRVRLSLTMLTLCVLGRPVAAQAPSSGEAVALARSMARVMAPIVAMGDFSGRILLVRHDTVLLDAGYTALGDRPSHPETRFAIGSLTKTFTAAAVAILAQRGTLRLDDSVGRWVPEFHPGQTVTVAQLLVHSAGVPDYYGQEDYTALRTRPITLSAFARWIGSKGLEFTPGSRSNYSNSGYALLALVIERASGRPYETFVREAVLAPAGLRRTGFLRDGGEAIARGHNPGHGSGTLQSPIAFDVSWLTGSGGMTSTTSDLVQWVRVLRSNRLYPFADALDPAGWGARVVRGDTAIEQTARIPAGYTSQLTYLRRADVTVAILSDVQADVVTSVRDALLGVLAGDSVPTPATRQVITLPDSVLGRYVGRYQIAPGFVLGVRRASHGLELAGPDGDFLPLDAIGDDRFFFRVLQVTVTFKRRDGAWQVLDWNGAFNAERVEPPAAQAGRP